MHEGQQDKTTLRTRRKAAHWRSPPTPATTGHLLRWSDCGGRGWCRAPPGPDQTGACPCGVANTDPRTTREPRAVRRRSPHPPEPGLRRGSRTDQLGLLAKAQVRPPVQSERRVSPAVRPAFVPRTNATRHGPAEDWVRGRDDRGEGTTVLYSSPHRRGHSHPKRGVPRPRREAGRYRHVGFHFPEREEHRAGLERIAPRCPSCARHERLGPPPASRCS